MKRSVRLIMGLAALLVLIMITACNAGNNEPNKTSTSTSTPTVNPAEPSPSSDVSEKERVVKSLKGDISIPAEPQRVIGLSVVYPEFLYALGVTPIAVQNYHPDFPAYIKEPFKDTLKMGIGKSPNFEAILTANPDLIIAPTWWADKDYEQLSKIAPTVLLPQRDKWQDELRDIAEVLDKKDLAEKIIQDLTNKEAAAKEKLHTLVGDDTVMYMMILDDGLIIYGENIDRGSFIHKQLGLKPIGNFPKSELSVSISLEKIPEYNPDHIILQLNDDSNEKVQSRYKEMLESSLWKNMTAVKKNQVYIMGAKEWFNLGMSPLADNSAIDDVLHAFEKKSK
ncbi:ABC transporter substrate-binding protein [Paenibacillus eucommiae]|uniref:Iron complex transport system substrate-binding protein n=1 Tax=Paenibacillus eucommiae TaxID=1355755 RepID=A0ABS4IQQ4_9BACL|nr:ABC transporter substrate-binding protein [Paenibacillus eucommiae]MBP1989889.1 iron complex transport system substrate-binding protein [Paenibacillus eucommiae]